jgi:hypothetical protein
MREKKGYPTTHDIHRYQTPKKEAEQDDEQVSIYLNT